MAAYLDLLFMCVCDDIKGHQCMGRCSRLMLRGVKG